MCVHDMCVHMPVPQYVCRGQRTTLQTVYSPLTFMWVLGIELWLLGLHGKCLYPLNLLSSPRILISSAGYLLVYMNAADFAFCTHLELMYWLQYTFWIFLCITSCHLHTVLLLTGRPWSTHPVSCGCRS